MHPRTERTSGRAWSVVMRWRTVIAVCVMAAWFVPQGLHAAALDDCRTNLLTGNYQETIKQARQAIDDREWDEEWHLLLSKALYETGQYPAARMAVSNALDRYTSSVRLRMVGYDVYRATGDPQGAKDLIGEINRLANSRSWAYRDVPNLVALGRAALLLGADPRKVLDNFFDPAKKADANLRDSWLASGELALEKNDFALAAKNFTDAIKKFPRDPEMYYGLARAYFPGDRGQMLKAADQALSINTNHTGCLLLLAEHLIDGEDYEEASKLLTHILTINPSLPDAWAFRAVIANLQAQPLDEKRARESALKYWTNNPRVDHLIGAKLSQKYRFAEGARYQRQALMFDPDYLPARSQLAQDLLRLGEEQEGWRLADDVHKSDGYDVVAYNLATLKDSVAKFRALTNGHFIVRMSAHEADVYGQKVLELLERARTRLGEKYGLMPSQPTVVEIFDQQKDFAVRTFGMPGGVGYLGVCFGNVITANSPATHTANWEAVLWHEYCHVVTLSLTRNKMPRWLSEGISVYEERQASPVWGEHMVPAYREMILGPAFTPVGELSAAFMAPKSPLHLQFAYYESSLVVEFLIERYGLDKLKAILKDLGEGVAINSAIAKHTAPLEQVEKDFTAYARDRALKLAPGLDWTKPAKGGMAVGAERLGAFPGATAAQNETAGPGNPTNFYALISQGAQLVKQRQWLEAKAPLQKLISLYPEHTEAGNAYELLAQAHHALHETNAERSVLTQLAERSADATDAYLRLMELAEEAKDWSTVELNARRFLAVNPLVAEPHQYLAEASEQLKRPAAAIESYRTLLVLDPPDTAGVHYHLARLLQAELNPEAERQVLQALEDAPRFRDAHRLLLEINRAKKGPATSTNAPVPPAK